MDIEKLIEKLSIRGLGNGTSLGYHSGCGSWYRRIERDGAWC